jgi:MoxR-like ATPase
MVLATHPGNAEATELVKRFVRTGASPRGVQAVLLGAKIRALFSGRFAASIDDVRATAVPALRHRILRSFEGEAEGVAEDKILEEILKKLPESKG